MRKYILIIAVLSLLLSCSLPFNIGSLLERNRSEETEFVSPTEVVIAPLLPEEPQETNEPILINPPITQTEESDNVSIQSQPAGEEYMNLTNLIEEEKITIDSVQGSESNPGFTGSVLEIEIRNNSDESLEFTIPCGLIFVPADDSTQNMMVVQPSVVLLQPAETVIVQPFVVCINSDKAVPTPDDTFTVGTLADGKLLQLAGCFCQEDLQTNGDFQELLSIQYATWAVADETLEGDYQSMWEFLEQYSEEIPGLSESLQELMQNIYPRIAGMVGQMRD